MPGERPTLHITIGGFDPPSDLTWATLWQLSDREPWAVVARHETALHVRVSDCAHFRLTSSSVQILPAAGVRASTIRHLLLDQLLPLLLARDGHLVLHASGLRIAGGAIAIAGTAGAGKSTLAAALSAEGWTVTSDDGVLVEEGAIPLAVPAYPGLRLWPETLDVTAMRERCVGEVAEYSAKCRVAPPSAPRLHDSSASIMSAPAPRHPRGLAAN